MTRKCYVNHAHFNKKLEGMNCYACQPLAPLANVVFALRINKLICILFWPTLGHFCVLW